MNRHELRQLDLGLLVVFEALMADPSATRVAARLFMTQSAVSAALRRLREVLRDPLFVREGRHLKPTLRAGVLLDEIRPALDRLAGALGQCRAFDPASAMHTLRLGMPEDVELGLLPLLLQRLREEAPFLRVVAVRLERARAEAQLVSGELSALLDYGHCLPGSLRMKAMRSVNLCVLRGDRRPAPLDLDAFCRRPQVDLAACRPLLQALDANLGGRGRQRDVALQVAHAGYLPPLLRDSERLAVLPDFAAEGLARSVGLRCEALPLPCQAAVLGLGWSPARDSVAAEQWLRRRLGEILRHAAPA